MSTLVQGGPLSASRKGIFSNGDISTSAGVAGKETSTAVANGVPHSAQDTELQTVPNSPRSTAPSNAVAGPSNWSAASLPDRLHLEDSQTSFIDVSRYVSDVSRYPVTASGFCDVHTGQMEGVGTVALKKLRIIGGLEKANKRFRYEAEIWFRLDHPHVLRFLGIYQDGPIMHMTSPWQYNGHMTAYLGAHPDADRFMLLTQVADALAYLHGHDPQIIHGDIKGANILISDQGDALLCDFGLSMVLAEIAFMSGRPTEVNHGGTHPFMAPELMVGDASKTEASDTYAFAMLIVEAFTGEPPFRDLRTVAAVSVAVTGGQRPARSLDHFCRNTEMDRLWRLMELCWHTTPSVRPKMGPIKELLKWIHEKHESDPDTELVSKNLRDVVDGNITVADYKNLVHRRRRGRTKVIRYPRIWHFMFIDWMITVSAVSQIGLTATLISELSDPSKADETIGRILIPLGFSANIWICAIWSSVAVVRYTALFSEFRVRWASWILSWIDFGVHRILMSFGWMLLVADATAISVLSHAKRFHHVSTGRLVSLLLAYEILAWFLCFCTTAFGVLVLVSRRTQHRSYRGETQATHSFVPTHIIGLEEALDGDGKSRDAADKERAWDDPGTKESVLDDTATKEPVLEDTATKEPVLEETATKNAVSDNADSSGVDPATPLPVPPEEGQIGAVVGNTDGEDDERPMTARQKEKQAVRI